MKRNNATWLTRALLLSAILFLSACREPDPIGADVLPDGDITHPHFVDEFDVEMQTVQVDTVISGPLSRTMFGSYIDPEFGRIDAGAFVEFTIKGSGLIFGDSINLLNLDSLVLNLHINSHYGRKEDPMGIEVFEIDDPNFNVDSAWYSNSVISFDSTLDLTGGYTTNWADSGQVFVARIRLDDQLGERLLKAPADSIQTPQVFNEFFRGLHIRAPIAGQSSREPGAIYYLDMQSNLTTMTLHYHDDTIPRTFIFEIDLQDGSRFSRITRSDEQNYLFGQTLANPANDQYFFLQSGALAKTWVRFPSVDTLAPAGINLAELIIKVDNDFFGSNGRFAPPSSVFIAIADSSQEFEELIINPLTPDAYNTSEQTYTINLTQYIMEVIAGRRDNNGLLIIPSANGVSVNRAVIGGPGHPSFAPRLRIVYTDLPE